MIRTLIADDSAAFRFGLRTMLAGLDDVEVVDEAASGDEAVVRSLRHQPDVVLMDLDMVSADDGVKATARILEQTPHVGVLVLTMSADDSMLGVALRAGARGYLLKGATRDEIERALRTVAAGGLVIGAAMAARTAPLLSAPNGPVTDLSSREQQVLALIGAGMDNTAIAERLVLSPKTVRNIVSAVFAKLGASDRAVAARIAREHGLVDG